MLLGQNGQQLREVIISKRDWVSSEMIKVDDTGSKRRGSNNVKAVHRDSR